MRCKGGKMIKLKIIYEDDKEKRKLIECLSRFKIKKISRSIEKYTNGKVINRFSVDIE